MIRPPRTPLALVAALVCGLAGVLAAGPARAAASDPRRVWLAAPELPAELAAIAPALLRWQRERLAAAGLRSVVARGPSPVPGDGGDPAAGAPEAGAVGAREAGAAGAREAGAAWALGARLRAERGRAELLLWLRRAEDGALVAAERATGPVESLGAHWDAALRRLLPSLGVPSRALPERPPPGLGELAAASRALVHRDAGRPARAWREVQGKLSPLALRLREELRAAVRRSEGDVWERARVLAASGDADAAWALLAPVLRDMQRRGALRPEPLVAAGEVQRARRRLREAEALFARAAEADPGLADAWLGLAGVRTDRGEREAAREALRRAVALEPSDPRPLAKLARLEAEPAARADLYRRAGERAARRLDVHRARSLLARAAELDASAAPAASRALGALGALEEGLGRPAAAQAAFERAAGLAPDADTLRGVARARRARGDASGAESAWRRAVELEPERADARVELADLYLEQERADEALPLLEAARAAEPDHRAARRRLARALRIAGHPDRAVSLLVEAGEDAGPADLLELAAARRERGELASAAEALERAVALAPLDAGLHAERARVHAARGDEAAARDARERAALLRGEAPGGSRAAAGAAATARAAFQELLLSFAADVRDPAATRVVWLGLRDAPGWRTRLADWLHPRAPDRRALEAALAGAVADAFDLARPDWASAPGAAGRVDALFAFDSRESLGAARIADLHRQLGADASFLARLVRFVPAPDAPAGLDPRCAAPGHLEIELRMLRGREPEFVTALANLACLPGGTDAHGVWNPRAAALYGGLALLLVFPLVRGWGTLQVSIRVPPRTRGFFDIHVRRRPDRVKAEEAGKRRKPAGRLRRRLSSFSRYERRMAGPRNTFGWIPARRGPYFVTVKGPLLDASGREIVGHFLEEKPVRIERGGTAALEYDFRPTECAVEVRVFRGGQPARSARVAVRGAPDSFRYAPEGVAFLYVGRGAHTVAAGGDGTVVERTVRVESLERSVCVATDLSDPREQVFAGCDAAVDPYLQGDLATAAQALERDGPPEAARLVRALHLRERGDLAGAARAFEAAGRPAEAAELRVRNGDLPGAAELFERAGDFARAAETWRAAGDAAAAGRCYEAAHDLESAADCYRESGDEERQLDVLEKQGLYLEAGCAARERGDAERAIRDLQTVDRWSDAFGEARRLLAEIHAERGETDVALERAEEACDAAGGDAAPSALLELRAELLERAGRAEEALALWERIRARDALHPRAAERADALRRTRATARPAPAASVPPGEIRYEILGELGRGGMGVVYRARDLRLGREVALKRLPENLRRHPAAMRLFHREARAAAALNHPNIVTVYDAGEDEASLYLTMELLEGRPLDAILARRRRLAARDAVRIGMQVATGLAYAHARRIVHRDIKTSNLFFTRERGVKIMDFGLAKTIEEVRKSSTVIGGTPYFMAPEQAAGEAVDARTDLYALGVTLFQLVTGTVPFREGDLAYQHRHTPPPDPRERAPEVPEALAALILELLAKDPAGRPNGADVLRERLRPLA